MSHPRTRTPGREWGDWQPTSGIFTYFFFQRCNKGEIISVRMEKTHSYCVLFCYCPKSLRARVDVEGGPRKLKKESCFHMYESIWKHLRGYTWRFPGTETIVLCGWFVTRPAPGLAKFTLVQMGVITDFETTEMT